MKTFTMEEQWLETLTIEEQWSREINNDRLDKALSKNGIKIKEKFAVNRLTQKFLHDYVVLWVKHHACMKDYLAISSDFLSLQTHIRMQYRISGGLEYWYHKGSKFDAMIREVMKAANVTLRPYGAFIFEFDPYYSSIPPAKTVIEGCYLSYHLRPLITKFRAVARVAIQFSRYFADYQQRKYGPGSEEYEECKERFDKSKNLKPN